MDKDLFFGQPAEWVRQLDWSLRERRPLQRLVGMACAKEARGEDAESNIPSTKCSDAQCLNGSMVRIARAKREWECTADTLPQLVLMLDAEGQVVRANRTVESWGLAGIAEVPGRQVHDLLHPGCVDPSCYFSRFWSEAKHGTQAGTTVHCENDDPILKRHVQIQARPTLYGDEQPVDPGASSVVVIIHDITDLMLGEQALRIMNNELGERVKTRTEQLEGTNRRMQKEIMERYLAETALRDSRAQYRRLVESMHEGLATADEHGNLTFVNRHLTELLGYRSEEMLGQPALCFLDADSQPVLAQRQAKRQAGGFPYDETPYEVGLLTKDGQRVFVKVSPRAIQDSEGHFAGSFAVVTDLSLRVQAEEVLRKSETELKLLSAQLLTAQEMERKRIASELHDGIGQSMSAVKFCVEEASRQLSGCDAPEGKRLLESVVPRIQAAIEEVRRISMDLRPTTLDDLGILPTLAWFCREFQGIFRDIQVEKHIAIQEQDVSPAIKTVIFRIVQEAVNNAAKYAHADKISISLARIGKKVIELKVEDSGVGFDPAEVAVRSGSDHGYGLVSMRERADFSGGLFHLAASPGNGTQIRVTWPCACQESDGDGMEVWARER